MIRREAADAAQSAAEMLLDHRAFPLEAPLHEILRAARITLELAGFDPDERERGELYRAIVDYIGEDSGPRLLGGASFDEDHK